MDLDAVPTMLEIFSTPWWCPPASAGSFFWWPWFWPPDRYSDLVVVLQRPPSCSLAFRVWFVSFSSRFMNQNSNSTFCFFNYSFSTITRLLLVLQLAIIFHSIFNTEVTFLNMIGTTIFGSLLTSESEQNGYKLTHWRNFDGYACS